MDNKTRAQEILALAGMNFNGPNDFDPKINDSRFYDRVMRQGSIGLGDSYVEGWWDSENLPIFYAKLNRANEIKKYQKFGFFNTLKFLAFNLQNKILAELNVSKHYDLGNELYESFLGPIMAYSCGYFFRAVTLKQAQQDKLDLIALKSGFQPGQSVLDIGCGWGYGVKNAVEKYGVHTVGVTLSKEQYDYAKKLCAHLGSKAEIRFQDYRDIPISEKYDHIYSIGMFEHVGSKNHREYFEVCNQHLSDDEHAVNLLHTIITHGEDSRIDPWIDKHIFRGAEIPNLKQIYKASEGLFVAEDQHTFGLDYALTLKEWRRLFNLNVENLSTKYNNPFFIRMWNNYLACSEGSFLSRTNDLSQIVFSKKGFLDGYEPVRNFPKVIF